MDVVNKKMVDLLENFKLYVLGGASSDIKFSMPSNEVTVPNYPFVTDSERNFNQSLTKQWFDRHWTMSFCFAGIYLLAIFLGRRFMANRPRYELRKPLVCWNLFIGLFSLFGTLRTLQELIYVVSTQGLDHSICVPR